MTAITHTTPHDAADRPDSSWTGWAQWIALTTMMVDHIVRQLFGHLDLGWASSSIGRIALPAFAGMVAWHALFNTSNPYRYASRILVIGLAAQPVYMLMPRGDGAFTLNVCFTLAAGLTAATWLRQLHALADDAANPAIVWSKLLLAAGLLLALWWIAGDWLEYGHEGLLMVPLFMLAMAAVTRVDGHPLDVAGAVLACVPVLVVAGMMNFTMMAKSFTVGACVAILLVATTLSERIPQPPLAMPRKLWLSWYPGHLAAIALIGWWLW